MLNIRDNSQFNLDADPSGRHVFGGPPTHKGATPIGSSVSTHKLLTLDLECRHLLFDSNSFRFLPLYYPLKYGGGGPAMQYSVLSDEAIEIIYLSDEPDVPDSQYVRVDAFPEVNYSIGKQITPDDHIDWFTLTIGGSETLDHSPDSCKNPKCDLFNQSGQGQLLASVPPIPIAGYDEIWWEFDGAYMLFYFWLCNGCNTIITSNRST